MPEYDYDLFVIGAGSGGTRAARVSASYGAKVAVAEEYRVGGTCVIRGCVPKKMLVYGSHFSEDLEDGKNFGWTWENAKFDWIKLRDHILKDVDRLNNAYTETLKNHDVEIILERAEIAGPHEIKLASGKTVTAKYILIAVGAWPDVPEFPGSEHMLTSNEMFHLDKLPETIIISGGGYIANEFAGIFNGLGSEVFVVNRSSVILRGYDESLRDRLLQIALTKGINYKFNCTFDKIEKREDGALDVYMDGKPAMRADVVLAATGRRPKIDGLGLENAGVETNDKGAIKVNEYSQTNVDNIYAVGDVTDRVQLTPVAIREGQAFAETVFNNTPKTVDYSCIPSAVFSQPPIASVGMTEGEARMKYGNIKVYSSDFRAMRNAFADRPERSLYKMIVEQTTEKILGLHMIGPDAPEILQAAAVAVKAGLTKQAFDDTIALHPSMAEELVLLK
ncbi:glutathione-disulfide reductase [Parasphingorhabdus halotolerans]|uniref:Glutathione reductase n=1 Tax=Parasphingorhabdus halotolerans TaxID=2725558 RepID=A0A6H2DJB7_9SPHN|nr:glutathione-disulfide reductase [Parasphingorhabdus halotolerans]QJB68288.1 glutathione-disulfide reductase [Parasphingorhabdus halotolerans]